MNAPENESKQKHWAARFLLSKRFIIAVAVVVAYTLIGFFLMPYLIHHYSAKFAEEKLNCNLAVEEVRVNPYALTLKVKNFDLKEKDGSPLIAFQEFFINFQVSSLWRWAFTFADVRLERPSLNVEIMPDGVINFVRLLDRIPKEENENNKRGIDQEGEGEAPPPVIVEHIALHQGQLVFTDLSDSTRGSVTLEPLGLELKNFTTLPDEKGMHSFEATLPHGGKLLWAGELSAHPFWSEGNIEVKGFNVATAWEFLQDEILLQKPKGAVDLSAEYHFALARGSNTLLVNALQVHVSNLSLKSPDAEEPIFTMEAIELEGGHFDLGSHAFSVEELTFSQGSVMAGVDDQGRLNFQELMNTAPETKPASAEKKRTADSPWKINVKRIGLDDFSVKYIDGSRPYPFQLGVASLGMKLKAGVVFGPETSQATVEDADIRFSDISLREATEDPPVVNLQNLLIQGGQLDFQARQLDVEKIALEGGHAGLLKEKEGTFNLKRLLGDMGAGKPREKKENGPEGAEREGKPWNFTVQSMEMTGFDLDFSDQNISSSSILNLENMALNASEIHSDFKQPIPFEASVSVRQGGSIQAKGHLGLAKKEATATLQVSDLNLTPIQPYLAEIVLLTLDSGILSLSGEINHVEDRNDPDTTFAGTMDVRDFLMSESGSGKRFLSWKEMALNDLELNLVPDRLEVAKVYLKEPYGKLIIYEDQSINLKKVLRSKTTKPEKTPPDAEKDGGSPVNVRKIQIENGVLDFADLSLRLQFATRIHELEGSIVGLSTSEGERAQVQLDGRVDDYGMSKIRGQLEPFNPKHFTDVSMKFRNIEMTSLTPYSAEFAGYKMESGKLSLDLRYRIKSSELQGENQILLDQLTLGEKVENPDAPDIPLHFALALLKDSNDQIDIGLPVSGNLDDPQFEYSHLIWKALLNLFKKIITAPFKALSSMLGIESEKLDLIVFETGETTLPPPAQEKVKNLSELLAKRPQLTLKIQGKYNPTDDRLALKSFAIRHMVAEKMGEKVGPDKEPPPIDLNHPQVQKAIKSLVRERISPQALSAAKENAAKRAAAAAKKGEKGIPKEGLDRDFYTGLLQKLFEAHQITETELEELARNRAKAIKEALVSTGKVDGSRLNIIEPSVAEGESEGGVGCKLTLDASH